VAVAVRQVSHRGNNTIGRFPSLKMKRMISFESLIECDLLYLLDYEPEVERFEEQPLTIEYADGSSLRHYTPDFHVVRFQHNLLIECKPQAFIGTEENRRKFNAAKAWCAEHDWTFGVVTDQDLRAGSRLSNVKFLTRYARQVMQPEFTRRVFKLLAAASPPQTMAALAQSLAPANPAAVMADLWHLAFHHVVVVALDEGPLSTNSPVELSPHLVLEV
jgi:TnsA endonuclease-like protein